MKGIQSNTVGRRGLTKKPYSAALGVIVLIGIVLPVFSAGLLAFDFLGYHAPGHAPHPKLSGLLLLLGLVIASIGQQLSAGRNEGIGARGWQGIMEVLHIRLAYAGLVFMGLVLKYAVAGKTIHMNPVGVLTMISGFFLASRLLTKYVFHDGHRRRAPQHSESLRG
jgi:hypothetical protein